MANFESPKTLHFLLYFVLYMYVLCTLFSHRKKNSNTKKGGRSTIHRLENIIFICTNYQRICQCAAKPKILMGSGPFWYIPVYIFGMCPQPMCASKYLYTIFNWGYFVCLNYKKVGPLSPYYSCMSFNTDPNIHS